MTDEEIMQTLQEHSDEIEALSDPEKTLTKEEQRHKLVLTLQKETLQRIKEARERKNASQELSLTVQYGLLNALAEKHPFLLHFLQGKFRMNIF